MINNEMMSLNMTRIEMCDLMMATLAIRFEAEDEMRDENTTETRKEILKGTIKKWTRLHDEIKRQIDEFDESLKDQEYEEKRKENQKAIAGMF